MCFFQWTIGLRMETIILMCLMLRVFFKNFHRFTYKISFFVSIDLKIGLAYIVWTHFLFVLSKGDLCRIRFCRLVRIVYQVWLRFFYIFIMLFFKFDLWLEHFLIKSWTSFFKFFQLWFSVILLIVLLIEMFNNIIVIFL